MRMPNLFILGASKSRTTSLYNILKEHPEIFLTTPKAPVFFCDEFQVVQKPIKYFDLFSSAGDAKVAGESSRSLSLHAEVC